LGAMIEIPAAALAAQEIVRHADFLSFGTNDLTQFVFAADRENAAVEDYYRDASEVIFRLLRLTHDDVPDIPLSLCGELAGRPEHIPRLLQCGIRTISIAAPLIPIIKETIRNSWCSAPPDAHLLKQ
jgi:phosphoenolpyruvate-protein kinase (PTS system EI component)